MDGDCSRQEKGIWLFMRLNQRPFLSTGIFQMKRLQMSHSDALGRRVEGDWRCLGWLVVAIPEEGGRTESSHGQQHSTRPSYSHSHKIVTFHISKQGGRTCMTGILTATNA